MGLIQDLQGRKLTGCRGCDAIRMGVYTGLDVIQGASTHDSFDASALGAYIESPAKARGSPITAEENSLIECQWVDGTGTVKIITHGDGTTFFDSSTKARVHVHGIQVGGDRAFVSGSFNSAITYSPLAGGWADVDAPLGYTTTTFDGASFVQQLIDKTTIHQTSDSAEIVDFSPIGIAETPGANAYGYPDWYMASFRSITAQPNPIACSDSTNHATSPDTYHWRELEPGVAGLFTFGYWMPSVSIGQSATITARWPTTANELTFGPLLYKDGGTTTCYDADSPGAFAESGTSFWAGADIYRARLNIVADTDFWSLITLTIRTDDADFTTDYPAGVRVVYQATVS